MTLRRPSLGTVLGAGALFVALGGVSAADDAVTSAARTISGTKITKATLTGTQVKDGTLAERDLARAVRRKLNAVKVPGPAGPQGPAGPGFAVGTGAIGAADVADGVLGGRDVGRFSGVLEGMAFGTINQAACKSISSTSLTAVAGTQSLLDDVIVVTPPSTLALNALTLHAQPTSANQIAVTICNVGSAAPVNVGTLALRYLSIDTA